MSGNLKREVLKKKWEGIIKGRQQSPLSFESYVQSHQISKSNFYKWQRRLKASSTTSSLSFFELPALTENLRIPTNSISHSSFIRSPIPFLIDR